MPKMWEIQHWKISDIYGYVKVLTRNDEQQGEVCKTYPDSQEVPSNLVQAILPTYNTKHSTE
jgi:hypothetical protein